MLWVGVVVWRWFSLASGVGLLIGLFVCSGLRGLVLRPVLLLVGWCGYF